MAVVGTTVVFQALAEVDEFFDALLEDESRFEAVEKVNALCDRANISVSQVLSDPSNMPDDFQPKFIQRLFITPEVEKVGDAVDMLLGELNREIIGNPKMNQFRKMISILTVRGLGRITYFNRPG